MSIASEAHDVFLSFSLHDASVAAVVRHALTDGGLEVFTSDSLKSGEDWGEQIQKALVVSQALVIVVSRPSELPRSMLVELGAAMAWKKPVFVLLDGIGRSQLPAFLQGFNIYPVSRLAEVVAEILRSTSPFSESERQALSELYSSLGIPVDRLLTDPSSLASLAERFNESMGANRSAERLAQELLTLRKRAALPKISEKSKRPRGS
jgi:hypothetical protein